MMVSRFTVCWTLTITAISAHFLEIPSRNKLLAGIEEWRIKVAVKILVGSVIIVREIQKET